MTAPIAALGQRGVRAIARLGAMARFFSQAAVAWAQMTPAGRRVGLRIVLKQVWFTALQALPLILVLASILSFLVISQAMRELGRLGAVELIGRLIVIAIVRELGPLLAALTVVGRSGTAIAVELATNKVMGEIKALEAMGIDPMHYLVIPRFLAGIVSMLGLIVFFDAVAIAAGLLAASANGMTAPRYLDIVMASLTFHDAWVTVVKALAFGLIVGTVPSFYGLAIRGAPTEVPVAASDAVVTSILAIFVMSGLFVLLLA